MSDQIPTHYAQEYSSMLMLLLQQRGSRLRETCFHKHIVGAKSAVPVDQIGKVEATKRTTRYPPLTPNDTPTDRPWVYPSDYDWNDLIDSIDKLRTLSDPTGHYAQNGAYAMGRAMDKEIIPAFFGDRKTGETGATTTLFPAGQVVAVDFAAAGAVGMTVAKLRESKRLMMAAEVDLEAESPWAPMTAKQHDNLLSEVQVISLDFNDRPVMVEGKITRFFGINFKHTELLQTDANAYRRIPVFVQSGVCFATWNDLTTDIAIRRDLAGLPAQVYVYGTFGATRIEEKRVVEIKCSEA